MRQPLWLINATLLLVLLIGELALFMMQASIPRRFSLEPTVVKIQDKQAVIDVEIKKIYGINDLFGTYVPEVPVIAKGVAEEKIPDIPEEPSDIPLSIPIEKAPLFIAPLTVTLKGIVYLHNDQDRSVAIVQFKDSKKEHNYRIGEMIQDAQILKIFPNRIVVVRSNGQQETLYLRDQDAKKDLAHDEQRGLEKFKVLVKDNKRYLSLEAILKQVHSLGQFIDMLDLMTVYKKGISIGCRVGKASKDSLGGKLGFENDDIIKKVDSIVLTDLNSRVEIYDHIVSKKVGDDIHVELDRNGQLLNMTFVLSDHEDSEKEKSKADVDKHVSMYDAEQNKKKILEQRVKLAPTAHQIQMDEQRKLMEARRKNMLSNRHGLLNNQRAL